ncbi:MAG: YtxH domain-containing protein [Cyclobacteriaceae bacterium]|nr:YtxH domain-containing protein [Cyclobacteriaceae bacterium]
MNNTSKIILGVTVAAAAGAAIGMLMAPERGVDLQKKIKDGATNWLNEFSTLLATGKGLVSEFNTRTNNGLEELTSELIDVNPEAGKIAQRS